jgi:curved DNA-binding protein CbpA
MPIKSSLVQTLLELHSSRGSGVLRIELGKTKKQLVLKGGLLVYAESNLPQEHLAKIMIAQNLLPQDKLKDITPLMKTGKTSEEAIFEACHPDSQHVMSGRREQAIVIMASLLGTENCTMHFYPGENLVRYHLNLNLALPELLGVSAKRAVKDRRIKIPPALLDGTVVLGSVFGKKAPPFSLSREETYVCSLVSEKMSIADLLALVPAGEASPEEMLMRLSILDLVKLEAKVSEVVEINPLMSEIEDMLLRFDTASAYETLSVKVDANQGEIQAAYHVLAKRFHPDRFQSKDFSERDRAKAERVFTSINAAYTTLRDPATRANYDDSYRAQEDKIEAAIKAKAAKSAEEVQVEALFKEGRLSLAKGDFEKAVEQLKSCVWLSPNIAHYNYYLGLAEAEIPRLRKSAERHLLKAIELESMSADIRLALAKLYVKVMLPRKAEIELQETLRWDPGNQEAQKLLAELEKDKSSADAIRRKR